MLYAISELESACLSAELSGQDYITIPWPGWNRWASLPNELTSLFGQYRKDFRRAPVAKVKDWIISNRKKDDQRN